jgi:hypothetical protein
MPSFSTSRMDTMRSAPAGRRALLAELDQPRVDPALQQELRVLVDAVVVHAAARVAAGLVAQVQVVVLGHEAQLEHARLQVAVARPGAALAAAGFELRRQARAAARRRGSRRNRAGR